MKHPIKLPVGSDLDRKIPGFREQPISFDLGHNPIRIYTQEMATEEGKIDARVADRRRQRRSGEEVPAWRKRPVEQFGLLTAPPDGGRDYGGFGENPARPKPNGGGPTVPLLHWKAELSQEHPEGSDGNWNDGGDAEEEPGLRQGTEKQIGGTVNMEDDVYLEFDEEEEEVQAALSAPSSWKMLARYMTNFKPSAKSMFDYFADEVWHLRTGVKYSERGKNYYMVTLFSQGDFDFVSRGGPWIFKKNVLLVKALDNKAQPSETILDSVPIWVRIYDIPWRKQDEETGMKYGDGLGKALEVDVPSEEQDKNEFLRVRVALPYDRRLQTQILVGVKGKPWATKTYKLKYERVPYYCSHCGFMGHRKNECEKKRQGVPSLDYEVYELRCSPYKKFEYRSHFVAPAGHPTAMRGLSFSSFGSAESHKSAHRRNSQTPVQTVMRQNFESDQVGSRDGFDEDDKPPMEDIDQGLMAQVGAMVVDTQAHLNKRSQVALEEINQPIVQMPDDDCPDLVGQLDAAYEEKQDQETDQHVEAQANRKSRLSFDLNLEGGGNSQQYVLNPNMLKHVSPMRYPPLSGMRSGPASSDMILAMRNLSNTTISLSSETDVFMLPAESVLGKRTAKENEVQGQKLELSLALNYAEQAGRIQKKGKKEEAREEARQDRTEKGKLKGNTNNVYVRKKAATGHGASGQLTRPNVWSRQGQ